MKEYRDLRQAKNEELKILADILTHDTDGEVAWLYILNYRIGKPMNH